LWQHHGSAPTRDKVSFGTCSVIAGIVVRLPFCTRPAPPQRRKLGTWDQLAATASWAPAVIRAFGQDRHVQLTAVTCLWYGCLHTRTVRVIISRDLDGDTALVTTALVTALAAIIERYATRRSIEQVWLRPPRLRPRRHHQPPRRPALVHRQDRALLRGHARQAPPHPDHRQDFRHIRTPPDLAQIQAVLTAWHAAAA
jgi:hypothetical protein